MRNTTYSSNNISDTLTIDDIVKAVDTLPKPIDIIDHIEICKKHWKELEKHCELRSGDPMWSSLSGIKVVIHPYLRKAKLFYRRNN